MEMERLEAAIARLAQALRTLEENADARMRAAREAVSTAAEVELLQAERERLTARVAALEDESRVLAGLTEEVEDRLDGAIAEIREVLGRN
jgi:predicted  nucleic acid-binding Zn-ribbon protein